MSPPPAFGTYPEGGKWHCTNSEKTFDTQEEAWEEAMHQYEVQLKRAKITIVKEEE